MRKSVYGSQPTKNDPTQRSENELVSLPENPGLLVFIRPLLAHLVGPVVVKLRPAIGTDVEPAEKKKRNSPYHYTELSTLVFWAMSCELTQKS